MKFNFKRIVPVLTGAILLGSTIGFATSVAGASVTYPSSFSDSVVVIGSASADSAAANDIAADLGKLTTTTTPASVSDGWLVKKSGDELNYGESFSSIDSSIDASDLAILADGNYKESKGNTDNDVAFEQRLQFTAGGDTIVFAKNTEDDNEPTDTFLKLPKTTKAFTYDLKFVDPVKYDNSTATMLSDDFKLSKLNILGDTWTITGAEGTGNHPTKLTLMGGATAATMVSGETKDLVMNGKTYSVQITVYSDKVQFTVNGESLTVDDGSTDELSDGTVIGVTEIATSSKESVADQATFYIGARKLVLENGQEVNLNGQDVDGSVVTISAPVTNNELTEIKVDYTPSDNTFVARGQSFTDPVFGKFKFVFSGLQENTEEMSATTSTDDGKFTVLNSADIALEVPFYDNDTDVYYGDELFDNTEVSAVTSAGRLSLANMVVSNGDSATAVTDLTGLEGIKFLAVASGGEARIVEIRNVDLAEQKMDFKDLTTDKEVKGVDYVNGSANTMDLGFTTVSLRVVNATGNSTDGTDGVMKKIIFTTINGYTDTPAGVGFETSLGGKVVLSKPTQQTALIGLYEGKDSNQIGNFTVYDASDGDMELNPTTNSAIVMTPEVKDSDQKLGLDTYNWGAIFSWDSKDNNDITITYPEEKVVADVYVAPVSAIVSGAGIVPVVKDTELGTYKTSKNLVVVGGPAINSIAAELMGLTFPTYGADAGFTVDQAMIKLYEGTLTPGKVALLVAGYEAKDTAAAAKALIAEKKFGTLMTTTASAYSYA